MYVASDPRSTMAKNSGQSKRVSDDVGAAGYFHFNDTLPFDASQHVKHWYAQAANFVVVYSQTETGAQLDRHAQADEYMMILPERGTRVRIEWGGDVAEIEGYSIVLVPGGPSKVTMLGGGPVIRFFTRQAADIVARCEALLPAYEGDPNVPALQPWPDPVGGFKVRSYSMEIEPVEGRFGRIFRSTNFMVNFIYPRIGARDRSALSPHKHDDFQQCSLCLAGTYVHHLRWPWGTDANTWREDDHEICGAPSVAIIPATVLHTSECIGEQINQLIDVFCPPRRDFSRQNGWVLNADEYPEPPEENGAGKE